MTLTIGSLFSGIGGLELGLERAGLGPVLFQCEIDPFCRAVLAKHWPNVTRYEDVSRPRNYPYVDILCGGFPCQDVSQASGSGQKGLAGARSGLWHHFARVVDQIAPAWVVVENVTSGAQRWLPTVRRHLHLLGYRTRALGIAARDVGAPHLRRRIFVVAHTDRNSKPTQPVNAEVARVQKPLGNAMRDGHIDGAGQGNEGRSEPSSGSGWAPEPDVGRVAHGVSNGMDGRRNRALGNAVVSQCAEVAGRVILSGLRTTSDPTQEKP